MQYPVIICLASDGCCHFILIIICNCDFYIVQYVPSHILKDKIVFPLMILGLMFIFVSSTTFCLRVVSELCTVTLVCSSFGKAQSLSISFNVDCSFTHAGVSSCFWIRIKPSLHRIDFGATPWFVWSSGARYSLFMYPSTIPQYYAREGSGIMTESAITIL